MDPTYDLPALLSDWSDVSVGGVLQRGFVEHEQEYVDEQSTGTPVSNSVQVWHTNTEWAEGTAAVYKGKTYTLATAEQSDGAWKYRLTTPRE